MGCGRAHLISGSFPILGNDFEEFYRRLRNGHNEFSNGQFLKKSRISTYKSKNSEENPLNTLFIKSLLFE